MKDNMIGLLPLLLLGRGDFL